MITEQNSTHNNLEKKTTKELLLAINQEDASVHLAVNAAIPAIEKLIDHLFSQFQKGGRLFYIGAGTSGRLGILDASECPPTFGVPHTWIYGLIAGGDQAIRKAVENAEDNTTQAWIDLEKFDLQPTDTVLGIAASGKTPYVIGALSSCQKNNITTACLVANPDAPLINYAHFPIVVNTGPEFLTGSTRMKAGTAQKLVLNMISTTLMIRLGRVKDNKMIHMQLNNNKLRDRGARMIADFKKIDLPTAYKLLDQYKSVDAVLKLTD